MKFFGADSGIVNMFMRVGAEDVIIYREDCESGFDRDTGVYNRSNKIKIEMCALIKPAAASRKMVQGSGGERASGEMVVQTQRPIYTSDERDGASADIIFMRDKYWRVMQVKDYCSYWEGLVQLMHETECYGFE